MNSAVQFNSKSMAVIVERKMDLQKIGKRLRQVRRRRGWSQEDIAVAVGKTRQTIGGIERGDSITDVWTLMNICAALEITLGDLDLSTQDWNALMRDEANQKSYIPVEAAQEEEES